jgi:hypothetical protein
MATFKSLADFNRELAALGKAMNAAEKRKITRAQAEKAQKIGDKYLSRDLGGDHAFRGWNRGDPVVAATQIKTTRGDGHILTPTRSGAGIITTVNQGRHQGGSSGFAGPGINRRTGKTSRTKSGALRKVRVTKGRRWNGTTKGKGTADDAVAEMESSLPKIADDGFRRVLRKHFDVT